MGSKPIFVITGPESTGKSTLCKALGEYYGVSVVLEYAREFLEKHGPKYIQSDLSMICSGQYAAIDKMILSESKMVISDTDALTIKIWSRIKYREVDHRIEEMLTLCPASHYFLCKDDIPWEEDPLREHPESRAALFEIYESEIKAMGNPYIIIKGSLSERLQKAISVIDAYKVD